MKMLLVNWFIIMSVPTLSLAETSKTRVMEASRYTNNGFIASVGECTLGQKRTGYDSEDFPTKNTDVYYVEYTYCAEKINYKYEVSGNYWDSKQTLIPNSDSEPYYVKEVRSRDFYIGNTGEYTIADFVKLAGLCEKQKQILMQQMLSANDKAKTSQCE